MPHWLNEVGAQGMDCLGHIAADNKKPKVRKALVDERKNFGDEVLHRVDVGSMREPADEQQATPPVALGLSLNARMNIRQHGHARGRQFLQQDLSLRVGDREREISALGSEQL